MASLQTNRAPAAVDAGKASLLPEYGPHLQPTPAFEAAMRTADSMAAKLRQDGRQ